jgi:AcrR family transcriptional regulator
MPRGRPAEPAQLDAVVEAGTRVFARLGYRRTRMSDVAREAGLSPGALYTYVESKDALFHLVLGGASADALPVPTPERQETLEVVDGVLRGWLANAPARAAIPSDPPADPTAEVAMIVGDLYDALAEHRSVLSILERSVADYPGLLDVYLRQGRRDFVDDLARYLERRAEQGALRATPDAAMTARHLIESAAWFAWHRHDDSDSAMIDDAHARAVVVDMAVAALVTRS